MTLSKAGINSQSGNRLDELDSVISELATKRLPSRQITTTPVDILSTDINSELISNIAGAQIVVVSDALNTASSVGDKVSIIQFGAGIPSISVSGAQTINGAAASLPIKARYQGAVITKIADNTWCVTGAI